MFGYNYSVIISLIGEDEAEWEEWNDDEDDNRDKTYALDCGIFPPLFFYGAHFNED